MPDWNAVFERLQIARADVAAMEEGEPPEDAEMELVVVAEEMAQREVLLTPAPDLVALSVKLSVLVEGRWFEHPEAREYLVAITDNVRRLAGILDESDL